MAWEIIALGTNVVDAGGDITLVEPTGTTAGDLVIACIAYKDTAAFTKPSAEWTQIGQLSAGDTDATSGKASGGMWYCIRGASAPGYVFTRTLGDVAMGQCVTYRGQAASPYDTASVTQAGSVREPIGTTMTTAEANELLVAMIAHGDNSLTVTMDAATNPGTASTTTVAVTTEPASNTWYERSDTGTNTGSDTGLFIADAIMTTAGATGAFSADAETTSDSVMIVAAFKISATVAAGAANIDGSGDIGKASEFVTAGAKQLVKEVIDTASASELLSGSRNPILLSTFDTANVIESVSLTSLSRISVDDTATATDVLNLTSLGRISISDSASVTDSLGGTFSYGILLSDTVLAHDDCTELYYATGYLNDATGKLYNAADCSVIGAVATGAIAPVTADTFDSVGVSEDVTTTHLALQQSTYDSVGASESVSQTLKQLVSSVSDTASATDVLNLTSLSRVSVFDTASATENVSAIQKQLVSAVFDTTSATDALNLTSLGRSSIYDTATATESVAGIQTQLVSAVFDTASATENVSAEATALAPLSVDTFDTTAVSENVAQVLKQLVLATYDTANVSESVSANQKQLVKETFDTVNVSESVATNLALVIELFDSVTAADLEARQLALVQSVADSVGASSDLALTSLARLSIFDTAAVSEDVDRRLNLLVELADTVNVTEDVTQSVIDLSGQCYVYDDVLVSDEATPLPRYLMANIHDSLTSGEPTDIIISDQGRLLRRITSTVYVELN